MSDDNKNSGSKPGNETSGKEDDLIDKGKDLADQAEDFFSKKANEFKGSSVFGKISDAFGKVEKIMEDKSQEFHSGEMGAKFETFVDKAGDQANELLKRAKEAGQKIGDQVDDTIDSIKGKKDQPKNQNGGGI